MACAIVATGFLLAALMFVHIAVWFWLRLYWDRPYVALIVAGGDVVLAIVLGLVAARSSPSRVELEALAVRRRALENAAGTLAFSAIAMQLLRLLTSLVSRRRSRS
jgi:hypothetical protein